MSDELSQEDLDNLLGMTPANEEASADTDSRPSVGENGPSYNASADVSSSAPGQVSHFYNNVKPTPYGIEDEKSSNLITEEEFNKKYQIQIMRCSDVFEKSISKNRLIPRKYESS